MFQEEVVHSHITKLKEVMETALKTEKLTERDEISELAERVKSKNNTRKEFIRLYEFTLALAKNIILKKVFNISQEEREILTEDCTTRLIERIALWNPVRGSWASFCFASITNLLIDRHRRSKGKVFVPIAVK